MLHLHSDRRIRRSLHHKLSVRLIAVQPIGRQARVNARIEIDGARNGQRVVHLVLEDALRENVVNHLSVLHPLNLKVSHLLNNKGKEIYIVQSEISTILYKRANMPWALYIRGYIYSGNTLENKTYKLI